MRIALFAPDIPQNTGNILRLGACLNIEVDIIEPAGFLFNDKRFKRSVMDYMDKKNIVFYKCADDFFKAKKNERVILMTTKAKKSYTKFKFKIKDTILFGRESSGVPDKILKLVKERLRIPMIEKKRSLNLSTSVAILLAENLRQTKYI